MSKLKQIEFSGPTNDHIFPRPELKYTICRICGPKIINGMQTFSVYDLRTGNPICPTCIGMEEALQNAKDYVKGKKVFWFGRIPMTKKWFPFDRKQ